MSGDDVGSVEGSRVWNCELQLQLTVVAPFDQPQGAGRAFNGRMP